MSSGRVYGLTVVGRSGNEELILCPFHEDRKPSAWFNPKTEMFYCAVCGVGMTAAAVAVRLGVEIEQEDDEEREPEDYDMTTPVENFNLGRATYAPYFKERGINIPTAHLYGIRYTDTPFEAAVFPIKTLAGHLCGVMYRFVDSGISGLRYKKLGKTTPLWPMPLLKLDDTISQRLFIFEGAFSAMRFHTLGLNLGLPLHSLALLGAKANQEIVDVTQAFDPIFIYDNDEAGKRACRKLRSLNPLVKAWTYRLSPDDMIERDVMNFFDELEGKLGEEIFK